MVTTKTFSPANIDRKELTMDIDRQKGVNYGY